MFDLLKYEDDSKLLSERPIDERKELAIEMVRHLQKYVPNDAMMIVWLASINDGITAVGASPSFKGANKQAMVDLFRAVATHLESGGDL